MKGKERKHMIKSNLWRLKESMRRAKEGKEVTVGFLGGSITQGSLSSKETTCYAYLVYEWWQRTFPKAKIHYVNGGIGGTSSHFGAGRVKEDMLIYQPDVVFVDFSVNDEAEPFFQETYEGVIRQLLKWQSKPVVVLLNNVFYEDGHNAQEHHNEIGDHYGIPHVSIKDTIYQQIEKGIYKREELSQDGLHPNDKGHFLVAEEIIRLLEEVKAEMNGSYEGGNDNKKEWEQVEVDFLKAPLTKNAYEGAIRYTIQNSLPRLEGFRADTKEKKGHLDCFKNGWIGREEGDKITFSLEGSCIAVQYRKTIQKPSPIAKVVLDGEEEKAILLDGNFEEDWGDCLFLQPILHHGENKKHTVSIEIIKATKEDKVPFYLLSMIVA